MNYDNRNFFSECVENQAIATSLQQIILRHQGQHIFYADIFIFNLFVIICYPRRTILNYIYILQSLTTEEQSHKSS